MAFSMTCPPCGAVLRAETQDELVDLVIDHAKREHDTDLDADHVRAQFT